MFQLTPKQVEAETLLCGKATHIMLYGGGRSGKTFMLVKAMLARALKEPGSRHVALRYRFNHAKQSLVYDTIPRVFKQRFPSLGNSEKYLSKSDWFYKLPNASEIWIGGVDDKERAEKILGNEYSTIYFNEASQIPYSSVLKVRTRLAQKNKLRNRFYYDENPPNRGHWTHKEFIEHLNPQDDTPLQPEDYASMLINPVDNLANIDPSYIKILEALPEAERKRFLDGQWGEAVSGAVYGAELRKAYQENRICNIPYNMQVQVETWWDLGDDYTAITFIQRVGKEIWFIDFHSERGKGPEHYAKILKEKAYNYSRHNLPWDGNNATFTFGMRSASQMLKECGISNVVHRQSPSVVNGINAVRTLFNRFYFDKVKCKDLLESIEAYHNEFDEKRGIYKDEPYHDWTSHACDTVRLFAEMYYEQEGRPVPHAEGHGTFNSLLDDLRHSRRNQSIAKKRI